MDHDSDSSGHTKSKDLTSAFDTLTKIRGKGSVSQLRKYLSYREGPVVYLTSRSIPSPDISSPRLEQFFLEDLHRRLLKKRLTIPGRLFIDFMEENGMGSQEPFTKADVRRARDAFRLARKCLTAVDEVVSGVEPDFRKLFHTSTHFTRGRLYPDDEVAYAYTQKRIRLGQMWISIFIQPDDGDLAFGVAAMGKLGNIKKLNRFLYWYEDGNELYTWHSISGQMDPQEMIPRVWADFKKLRRGLKKAF